MEDERRLTPKIPIPGTRRDPRTFTTFRSSLPGGLLLL